MELLLLTIEWDSTVPKSIVIVILGIFILAIGIIWLVLADKKNRKNNTGLESSHDYWYKIEGKLDIWGSLLPVL